MLIEIKPTEHEDTPVIFGLYDEAITYQKKVGNNHWLGFDPALIAQEINEGRHFKILLDGMIGATFIVTFEDRVIWSAWPDDPAIYIHRIAVSQSSRGNDLVKHIISWAKDYAAKTQLRYIRMDTGSGNDRLIGYYVKCGFTVVSADTAINYTPDLPAHYENGRFTLLEIATEELSPPPQIKK